MTGKGRTYDTNYHKKRKEFFLIDRKNISTSKNWWPLASGATISPYNSNDNITNVGPGGGVGPGGRYNPRRAAILSQLHQERRQSLSGVGIKSGYNAEAYTGWQDEESCVTTITITELIEIVGMQKEVTETITEDQLNTILRALFDLYEFDLTSITLDAGLNSRWEGYGYNEYEVKTAYFKGIKVNVNKKKNQTLGKKPKVN